MIFCEIGNSSLFPLFHCLCDTPPPQLYAKQTQTEVSSYEGEGTGSEDEDTEERAEPSYREVLGKTGETKEQESQVRDPSMWGYTNYL